MATLHKQITEREQKINDTTVAKDTAVLLELYKQQADDSRRVGDWGQFANYYSDRYNLGGEDKKFESLRIASLDSIIHHEDVLKQTDSLREQLALAYFYRLYEQSGKDNYTTVADYEKYMTYAPHANADFILSASVRTGNAWTMIGDNQMAITILKKAIQVANEEKNAENIAWISVNLANSYRDNEEWEQAIQTASAALNIQGVTPERKSYLNAVLAESYNGIGKTREALLYTNAALSFLLPIAREDGIPKRLFDVYKVKADVLDSMQQPDAALQSYHQALNYFVLYDSSLSGRDAGKTFAAMGRLHLAARRMDSTLYYCNRALRSLFPSKEISLDNLPLGEQVYHENGIMEVMDAASKAYKLQYAQSLDVGLLQKSLQCINLAFKTEELLRQTQIYDNSKYRQGQESRGRSERGIEICQLLWGATSKDKWLDDAFMYAEKSRSNVLLDKIQENLLSSLRADSSFTQTRQFWYIIKNLEESITKARRDSASEESITALTREKDNIEAKFATNKNRVNSLLQDEYKKRAANIPVSDIRNKLLNNHDAIVEYFAGDSLLHRFVLQKGKDNVEMSSVPLKTVGTLVDSLLPYLTDKDKYNYNPGAYTKLASDLYGKIFPSLPVGTKKILVIADGLLQLFPFEALVTNDVSHTFLLQKFRFTAAFSCASLLQQMNIPAANFSYDAVAFAPFVKNSFNNLPVLPQSKKETEVLRSGGNATIIYTDTSATRNRFTNEAAKGRILHIASHAFADGSDSVQPRIEFADGSFSLEKIYALQLNNRLVVLSACQTGIGKLVTAEGALSLARAFYYTGAKNVINSLWEVDDESAGFIFEHFYKHLKKTGSIDESLSLARREYFEQAQPDKQSPYYWASFVCVGDGNFTEPGTSSSLAFRLICIGGLLGLVMLLFVSRRRDRK